MSIWDEAKKNLVDWYAVTADKTTEVAKVTSRRYDKYGLSRDIERQFSELGSLVYNGLREEKQDILEDPEIAALVERIVKLEQALRTKEEEIEAIKRDHDARKAEASTSGGEAARVMVDPALTEGDPESAILMSDTDSLPTAEANEEEKDKDNPEMNA